MKEIIIKILNIPEKFWNSQSGKSAYQLLSETGYFEMHKSINEQLIAEILKKHSNYTQQWLNWSENKRTDSGYYIEKQDQEFIVGFIENNAFVNKKTFSSEIEAFTFFIKREIEYLRKI